MSRPCKRCLLSEYDPLGVYESIKKNIDSIPSSLRSDEGEYSRRLAICGDCGSLLRGTCLECGCYTELRAAQRDNACPVGKW
ncbi:MAG: hypothetical protein J6F31_01035 [Oscillospiraceae bacterium]|nr:hypothetical protein [Oscillospiraceae bacterium]